LRFRRFAVIGSNCFTGSHFVDALLERPESEVIGISRSPQKSALYLPYLARDLSRFRFQQGNLVREPAGVVAALDAFRPDVVINTAALSEVALSHDRPLEYFRTNTLGTTELAFQLKKRDYLKRYVHISSAEIYGSCPSAIPEDAPLRPSTPYAVSKAAADMYLLTLKKNFEFPVTLIRSTNVYGRHQQLFKIIPRTVIYLKQNRTIELHGGGAAVKSFIHIRDVVDGTLKVLEADQPSEIYHFSSRQSDTIAEVVGLICRLMGRDSAASVRTVGERLGQDARYTLDFTKAKKELGWEPQIPFERGVQEMIAWIESEWSQIQKESLEYVHMA
jgi:dTDP-glucose 4,6-dehydratase